MGTTNNQVKRFWFLKIDLVYSMTTKNSWIGLSEAGEKEMGTGIILAAIAVKMLQG